MNKLVVSAALVSAAFLSACSSEEETQEATVPVAEPIRNCDSIRGGIIELASTRGVIIVKIYEPETITDMPQMISCSGRAVVDSGQQATLYYRNYKDQEGDWLLEYSEQPFK